MPRAWFKHARNWFEPNTLHVSKQKLTPEEIAFIEKVVDVSERIFWYFTTLVITGFITLSVFSWFGLHA